jgi:hypothetical protein
MLVYPGFGQIISQFGPHGIDAYQVASNRRPMSRLAAAPLASDIMIRYRKRFVAQQKP